MYSFWIQKERDRQNLIEAENLRVQAIRVQWYKDLVISPNIEHLDNFYETLHEIRSSIIAPDLSNESKTELIEKVKEAQRQVRKDFG